MSKDNKEKKKDSWLDTPRWKKVKELMEKNSKKDKKDK